MASRLVRVLLPWLMLLALPLQGVAASGGWPCHAASSGLAAVVTVSVGDHGHADPGAHGHRSVVHSAQRHAHAAADTGRQALSVLAAGSADLADPAHPGSGDAVAALHVSAGCAVCANCGHAIGLPSAWPALDAAPAPAPPLAWVLPSWPRPDWPVADKPPRA